MKKWILKAEVTKILNTYSIRKDEFEAKEGLEYYYENKFVKGYLIHISEEIKKGGTDKNDIKTGRIIVTHTKPNGKITFNDIWERNKEGKLEFLFRNMWNQPISDGEYIKDLNEDIEKMKEQYHKLINDTEYQELKREKIRLEMELGEQSEKYQELIFENEKLKEENQKLKSADSNKDNFDRLQKRIEKLQQENQRLKNEKHNARGAGRKPSQERLNAIEQVKKLLEAGASEQEIKEQLGISKATFYRYKRNISN